MNYVPRATVRAYDADDNAMQKQAAHGDNLASSGQRFFARPGSLRDKGSLSSASLARLAGRAAIAAAPWHMTK
ncbi:MAG: hypothetical protein ACP5VR_12075 [Acidimicrobiales bacterium]